MGCKLTESIILGIDPGSQVTGFCVMVQKSTSVRDIRIISAGVIRPKSSLSHSERLGQIHQSVFEIAQEYQPQECAIEKGFTSINHKTALRLGETRGAIIAAIRRLETPIVELTPTEVKKHVTGNGHAAKEDVARTLFAILGFDRGSLPFDVTDAVAIAYCFSLLRNLHAKISIHQNLKSTYHYR